MSERAWSELQCLEGSLRVPGIVQPLTVTRNTGGGRASFYPVAAPARVVGDHTIELKLNRRTNFHDNHKPIRNGGRVFMSDRCVEGRYARAGYTSMTLQELFDKTVSITVDLSAAKCGCAASFRLVPMAQNSEPGRCDGDYYCDAAATCGVSCAEITLFEANRHAFIAKVDDNAGGGGLGAYGLPCIAYLASFGLLELSRLAQLMPLVCTGNGLGGSSGAFGDDAYGPHGTVIDTTKPFRVHAHFVLGAAGGLANIKMTLQQNGAVLPQELEFLVADSFSHHADAGASQGYMNQVAEALGSRGLTPVLEYRSAESMATLDSPPCQYYEHSRGDEQDDCGDIVRFADMSVSSAPSPPLPMHPPAPLSDADKRFGRLFDEVMRHHSEQPPAAPSPAPLPPRAPLPPPRPPPPPPIPQWPIQGLPFPPPPQQPSLQTGWRPNNVLLAVFTLCGIVVWLLARHSRGKAGRKTASKSVDDELPVAVDLQLRRLPTAPTEPAAD